MNKIAGVRGFEPRTYSLHQAELVEGCRAIQAALHPHTELDLKSIFKVDYFNTEYLLSINYLNHHSITSS
jgi:hypothetical protein